MVPGRTSKGTGTDRRAEAGQVLILLILLIVFAAAGGFLGDFLRLAGWVILFFVILGAAVGLVLYLAWQRLTRKV